MATADGAQAEVVAYHVLEAPDQENEASAEFSPAIIAESTTQLRRLSVSAAVLDLDLTGAPVVRVPARQHRPRECRLSARR